MSIQSTRTIDRSWAISRIKCIATLCNHGNYREIEERTSESDYSIWEFVKGMKYIDIDDIDMWTNSMLEEYMDKPFFRYSLFDNYFVVDDEDYE